MAMFKLPNDPLIDDLLNYANGDWFIFRSAMSKCVRNADNSMNLTDLVESIDNILEERGLLNGRKKFQRNLQNTVDLT